MEFLKRGARSYPVRTDGCGAAGQRGNRQHKTKSQETNFHNLQFDRSILFGIDAGQPHPNVV